MKRLYRSTTEKKIAGICAGFGHYFGLDPTLVRIIFVVALFITGGLLIPAYLIGVWVIPKGPDGDDEYRDDDAA